MEPDARQINRKGIKHHVLGAFDVHASAPIMHAPKYYLCSYRCPDALRTQCEQVLEEGVAGSGAATADDADAGATASDDAAGSGGAAATDGADGADSGAATSDTDDGATKFGELDAPAVVSRTKMGVLCAEILSLIDATGSSQASISIWEEYPLSYETRCVSGFRVSCCSVLCVPCVPCCLLFLVLISVACTHARKGTSVRAYDLC